MFSALAFNIYASVSRARVAPFRISQRQKNTYIRFDGTIFWEQFIWICALEIVTISNRSLIEASYTEKKNLNVIHSLHEFERAKSIWMREVVLIWTFVTFFSYGKINFCPVDAKEIIDGERWATISWMKNKIRFAFNAESSSHSCVMTRKIWNN